MAQYVLLVTEPGKALSLAASAKLVLADRNPLDKYQHFRTTALPFIHTRNDETRVLDITANLIVEGNPVGVWIQKQSENANQQFTFTSPSPISSVTKPDLHLFGNASGAIILSAQTPAQVFTAVPVPAEYVITIQNNTTTGPLSVSFDNAPASEATTAWAVAVGTSVNITLLEGSVISVKDAAGKVLAPTPYRVSKVDTLVFVDPVPEPQTAIELFDGLNLAGGKISYTGPEPNLGTIGWNDRVKSWRVIAGTWILYQDYFTGNKIVANPKGGTNLDGIYNQNVWGGWPGTLVGLSSFRPLPAAGLSLFTGYNFDSVQTDVNTAIPDLSALKPNGNNVASVIVVSGVWELWDRPGYQGNRRIVSATGGRDGTGFYTLPSLWGGRLNATFSIKPYDPNFRP